MNPFWGTVIGLVYDLEDPEGLGRVRLKFPWLAEETDSGWARILRPMAGADRGFYFMPEKDDEVLVAFEHGDVRFPYVIGGLYNRVDEPPDDDIDIHVRRIKSTSGHILDFDDRDGKERVRVKTQGGHSIVMDDKAGSVTITTNGGQKLVMEDAPKRITLKTDGGTTVEINDMPSSVQVKTSGGVSVDITDTGGVKVNAPSGMLDITCLAANLNATTTCSVTAPMTTINSPIAMFSGIVQCQTLMATSVISASYTPGVGNIW